MYVCVNNFRKIQRNKTKTFSRKHKTIKDSKLSRSNSKTNKYTTSKSVAKNNTEITLTITKKSLQDDELPHELYLTTRQKNKIKCTFTNNISKDLVNLSWLK